MPFPVTSYPFPIQRALKMRVDGRIEMFDPSQFQAWSQDLQEAYHDAGQFYWGTKAAWSSGKPTFGPHSVPVILSRHCVPLSTHQKIGIRLNYYLRQEQHDEGRI